MDLELVQGLMPALGAGAQVTAALVADVPGGEAEQLERRGIGREVAAGLGDLAELEVDRLDEVRGVDDLADLGREPQKRGELLPRRPPGRSEAHTSEIQSLMRISYAVFCLNKKKHNKVKKTNQRK